MLFTLYTYISSVRYEQLEFFMLSCLRCNILVAVNTDIDVCKTIWGPSPPISENDEHIVEEGNLIVVGTHANLHDRHKVHIHFMKIFF